MDVIKIESLNQLFHLMVENEASDMHLQVGSPPVLRIRGETVYMINYEVLLPDILHKMIYERLSPKQVEHFEERGDCDLALGVPGLARFRLNILRQRGSIGLVARAVPTQIKTVRDLHLPESLSRFCEYKDGLVIIAGATGCGKSTTLASLIEQINQTRSCHILTIEDPIEYLYRNKKAYINQREVGIDVLDFHSALRTAVRQDPNIILIGEMRDQDTVEFGLTAAETGHLVFGTIHSSNVPQTLTRILDLFPSEKHRQIRTGLYFNLRGIACQKLIPAIDPNIFRVPACEIMFNNAAAKKLIREEEDGKLYTVIECSEKEGMQSFNKSLFKLVNQNFITNEMALRYSPNPEELKMNLQGIFLSKTSLVG
jgi:twitching motility protein PilT